MKYIYKIFALLLCLLTYACSSDVPVDDRGLLITEKEECTMSAFQLRGTDDRDVLVECKIIDIDEVHGTVTAIAAFGTNLKHVKPNCSISQDAILEPKMGSWIDFSQPREYTVVAGDRKTTRTYTVTIKVQGE